jgi:hypothetical protein
MSNINAPLGYTMEDLDNEDKEAVRDFAIHMSDDPEWQKAMTEASYEDLLQMLKDNGFEIDEETN